MNKSLGIVTLVVLLAACGADSPVTSPPDELDETPADVVLVDGVEGALPFGGSHRFVARAFADGALLDPQPRFHWWSSDTSIARVDSTGVVTGNTPGSAMIYASLARVSGVSRVSVDRFGVLDTLDGRYFTGFEANGFVPCGVEESWWITEQPAGAREYMAGKPEFKDPWGSGQPSGTVYVRWSIRRSLPGNYGHMGGYRREAKAFELLIVRDTAITDCR